jgi:hypothetical protein
MKTIFAIASAAILIGGAAPLPPPLPALPALPFLPLFGQAQEGPQYQPCAPNDTICRLDRLEDTVDMLLEQREDGWRRPGGGGGRRGGVAMPTSFSCQANTCARDAGQMCQNAGFQRGLPTKSETGMWGQQVTEVTCFD